MKISNEKPPCYDDANALFKLEELKMGTIFTFGDTLYNPSNIEITQDLIAHEEVHGHQQQHDPVVAGLWWKRYLAEPEFRMSQETEAYGRQYKFLCGLHNDRNKRARMLNTLAGMLSSPMYGGVITHTEALKRIREARV